MPLSDHDALLTAIVSTPADDLPRLVYADWLEEHDQGARAECSQKNIEWHEEHCPLEAP